MKTKVVWSIRWNLLWGAKPGSGKSERTPERKTREWNDRRIDLYERFCQPGLVAQTYDDFEVWLKCDPELKCLTEHDPNRRPLCKRLADGRFSVVYMPDLHDVARRKAVEWEKDGYEAILACRIDSDDCLHGSAVAEMVKAAESMDDKKFVQLDQGLVYDLKTEVLRDWNNPSPPFIGRPVSISEVIKNGMPPNFHHAKVRPQCKTIRGRWYYLVICHGTNVCNRVHASFVGRVLMGEEKTKALNSFRINL